MTDLQNPLFIHPSDNSGMNLCAIQLVGENYRRWSRSFTKALSVKNKLWLIDGSIARSTENALQWDRCNDMVCSWLLNTVSKDIYNTIDEYDIARDMWLDLEESYGQKNGPLIFEIKREIHECRQDDSELTEYFTKLKGLWRRQSVIVPSIKCKCGKCECDLQKQAEESDLENKLMTFLMGLHERYDGARRQMLMTTPLPSPSTAHSLLLQGDQGKTFSEKIIVKPDPTATTALVAKQEEDKQKRHALSVRQDENR